MPGYDPRFPPNLQDPQPQPPPQDQPYAPPQYPPPQYPQQPYPPQVQQPYYPPRQLKLRGQTMVRVVGILMIIFGGLGLLFGLIGQISGYMWVSAGFTMEDIISLMGSAFMMVAGITGVMHAGNSSKGQTVVTLGVIIILYQVIGTAINLITYFRSVSFYNGFDSVFGAYLVGAMIGLVIGLGVSCILPILYIVGGSKLKRNEWK